MQLFPVARTASGALASVAILYSYLYKNQNEMKSKWGYSQPREARSAAHLFPPPEVKTKGSEG
jgi:hypothetical protein